MYLGARCLLVSSLALSCAKAPPSSAPYVVAADAKDAQSQVRHFKEQWELSTPLSRRQLRADLEQFVRRYRGDPSSREAELMLAEIALDERRFDAAIAILEPLLAQPAGRLRDEAQLIMAAVEIRQGKPDAGLLRLAPLEGKLMLPEAEERFYREQIGAALLARRWRLAVDAMHSWLEKQDATKGRSIKQWVSEALAEVPAQALLDIVKPERGGVLAEPADETRRWLLHAMIERIARAALETQDAQLASALLEWAPPWLKAGEQGEALLSLSSQAATAAQIAGRALGFVLGGETELVRTRNMRVAAGVLLALSESRARGVSVDYLTAEDQAGTAQALGDLSGQGASLVIGGVDEASARAALLFAQTQMVPTMVLVQPRVAPPASSFGFVVGVSEAEEVAALTRAQEPEPLVLGGERYPCAELLGQQTSELLGQTKQSVIFLGEASCLRAMMGNGAAAQFREWSLGLLPASGPLPEGALFRHLTCGSYPPGPIGAEKQAGAKNWDWFFALGYDSAQLGILALGTLPSRTVTERDQVRAVHERAALSLKAVRGRLVTSDVQGFDERHRIARQLVVAGER